MQQIKYYLLILFSVLTVSSFAKNTGITVDIDDDVNFTAIIKTTEGKAWDQINVRTQWHEGGRKITPRGDEVIWGYFYVNPEDMDWGNMNNPELFVKVWKDINGYIYVNYFHVSVPKIEMTTFTKAQENEAITSLMTMSERYVQHRLAPETTQYIEIKDTPCSILGQNKFVYETMQDVYLWYDKMPQVDHRTYLSPENLLDSLMYHPRDRWSYISSQTEFYSLFEEGKYLGTGFALGYTIDGAMKILYVYQDSPAARAGLVRGDKVLEINHKTIQQIENEQLWLDIFGKDEVGVRLHLKVEKANGVIQDANLQKDWVQMYTVLHTSIIEEKGKKIGYLVFDSFLETSFEELNRTFNLFKKENINELILDLRYNGGGILDVASYLSSLITGKQTNSKVFEKMVFNDKHQDWNENIYFSALPNSLNLSRVIILTSEQTASASESVINALKPFIDVVLIGETTHGKPVGMISFNFCEKVLVPVMMIGENAVGDSDYFDGFKPTCAIDDDIVYQFGNQQETLLKEALYYSANNHCSVTTKSTMRKKTRRLSIPLKGLRQEIGAF